MPAPPERYRGSDPFQNMPALLFHSNKAAVKLKKTFLIKRVFLICLMKGKCKANQTFPVLQCFSSHIPLVMAVFQIHAD